MITGVPTSTNLLQDVLYNIYSDKQLGAVVANIISVVGYRKRLSALGEVLERARIRGDRVSDKLRIISADRCEICRDDDLPWYSRPRP